MPRARCSRYFWDVADRSRLSPTTPITVPSWRREASIACSSTPRAAPETTEYPCSAALRPNDSAKPRSSSPAFREPTTAIPRFPTKRSVAASEEHCGCAVAEALLQPFRIGRVRASPAPRVRLAPTARGKRRAPFRRASSDATLSAVMVDLPGAGAGRLDQWARMSRRAFPRRCSGAYSSSSSQHAKSAHSPAERGFASVGPFLPKETVRSMTAVRPEAPGSPSPPPDSLSPARTQHERRGSAPSTPEGHLRAARRLPSVAGDGGCGRPSAPALRFRAP